MGAAIAVLVGGMIGGLFWMPLVSRLVGQNDSGVRYTLRTYTKENYRHGMGYFLDDQTCFVCGHHLPVDQFEKLRGKYVHSDYQICKALGLKFLTPLFLSITLGSTAQIVASGKRKTRGLSRPMSKDEGKSEGGGRYV